MRIHLLAALGLSAIACASPPPDTDWHGVVLKPIPEKLVVLTLDDACASHAAYVAPLLKKLGFGATFYITRFGNPAPDPKIYMSWEQIKGLETAGFEVGNHTWSHSQMGGGQANVAGQLPDITKLEDQCVANSIAKPTTFCWPIYSVNPALFSVLLERGYLFGRSGGRDDRPYRPTLENPFETPSFTIMANTPMDTFTNAAQRATRGRISIFTFHGVPDIEHAGVGVEPARFGEMMRYLKDNHYTVIAMRDIARYVDVKRATKLLPLAATTPDITISDPAQLASNSSFKKNAVVCDVKVADGKLSFAGTGKGRVAIHLPLSDKQALAHIAEYALELLPQSGTNQLSSISLLGSELHASPQGLNGAPLTLQNATLHLEDPQNTWKDFASTLTLAGSNTIRSLDDRRAVLTGKTSGSGDVTYSGFFAIGRVSSDSDGTGNTRIAQDEWLRQNREDHQSHDDLMFGIGGTRPFGMGVLTIAGKVGTRMGLAWFGQSQTAIPNDIVLESALVFNWHTATSISLGHITGPGALVKVFDARDINPSSSTLHLLPVNTYKGGTRFFSGNLLIDGGHSLGNGPVTLGGKSPDPKHVICLRNGSAMTVSNSIELAGITDATINGPCPTFAGFRGTVANDPAALSEFNTALGDLTLDGTLSGSGGLLKNGPNQLALTKSNAFTGPIHVAQGRLVLCDVHSLGPHPELTLDAETTLELKFNGQMAVRKFVIAGHPQPAGVYGEAKTPNLISGPGTLQVRP
ncbi:MAG: polysaccharide deacetylase family protein [Verrucomicrobiota bacterium]